MESVCRVKKHAQGEDNKLNKLAKSYKIIDELESADEEDEEEEEDKDDKHTYMVRYLETRTRKPETN